MIRSRAVLEGVCCAVLLLSSAWSQYPGAPVKKPVDPNIPKLRSTAVLEWVGEPGKPSASRVVPVAVFDGERYQDGGLYLSQPEPLAVLDGTEYELQNAGVPEGKFVIFHAGEVDHDWFGYGVWRPLPPPKVSKSKPSKTPPRVVTEAKVDKPATEDAAANKDKAAASGTASTPSTADSSKQDPNGPTLHRRTDADSSSANAGSSDSSTGSGASASSTGSSDSKAADADPDRPTLHRRDLPSGSSDSSGGGANTADVDPDRPTLHRHTDAAAAPTGERDPDRPTLRRGLPAAGDPALQASRLTGMPPDLQQMVAVSDTSQTEDHPFAYHWGSADDAQKMKAAIEDIARKAIAASATPAGFGPSTAQAAAKTGAASSKTAARRAAHKPASQPALLALADEKFAAYELSYSGGATLVLTASSGTGAAERDVTVIAQPDFYGVPHVLLQSVADSAHLDMTPRMRLVDAVDTDGDNRAELIFELRGETERQFAIYKVVSGRAEQVFATGPLPDAATRD